MTDQSKVFSKDVGLLVVRLGVGTVLAVMGWKKWLGGEALWESLGGAMKVFGITVWPVFWGFMAMFSELVGGLMLVLGLLVRPFAALLLFTMVTATLMQLGQGDTLGKYAHSLNLAFVFAGLLFAGGGRYALGNAILGLRGKWFT